MQHVSLAQAGCVLGKPVLHADICIVRCCAVGCEGCDAVPAAIYPHLPRGAWEDKVSDSASGVAVTTSRGPGGECSALSCW